MYNPLLILSYNHLVSENESRNFVDEISSKVGFPNWEKSAIFYNKIDKSNAVFVPLIKNSASNVNGIISFNIINGKMVTNGYLRSNVEHSLQKDKRNYFIAKHFANFDKEIYGISPTPAFLEYLCECENSDPTVLNPNDCEWQLVKLCKDSGANVGWVDGQKPIYPIHLDHDADGVPNDDDQDWFDWSTRHNVSQEEFEKRVRDSWNQNQFDEYGDYDLFWEEFDDFITDQWDQYDEEDPGGGSLNFDWIFDIFDFFSDFFGSIINWFEDRFDDFWEWIDFWDDVHCPWDDINSSLLENRTISCDWYYIKNCNGNNSYHNWWESFNITLDCDILDYMQSDVAEKLKNYINSSTTINPCTGLPLNKNGYIAQICDNFGYLSNDQEFLEGGAITPEIELVLAYDAIKKWQLSHNNNPLSTQLGNQLISNLCNNGSEILSEIEIKLKLYDVDFDMCDGNPQYAYNESPISQDNTYLNKIKSALGPLRDAGYGWFSDMIQELIDCNEFKTVGDLVDTWYLVKDFVSTINNNSICAREQYTAQMMMAIFSPENVGSILGFVTFGQNMSPLFKSKFRLTFANKSVTLCGNLSKGFNTFNEFKAAYGPAGTNKAWHHIVEQNAEFTSGFNPKMLHHPDNLIAIEGGFTGAWHNKITGAYAQNGRYIECNGQSLRQWLAGKPFEVHYEWGLKVLDELKP